MDRLRANQKVLVVFEDGKQNAAFVEQVKARVPGGEVFSTKWAGACSVGGRRARSRAARTRLNEIRARARVSFFHFAQKCPRC